MILHCKYALFENRGRVISVVLAFIYAITFFFGKSLDETEQVNFLSVKMWAGIVLLTVILALLLKLSFYALDHIRRPERKPVSTDIFVNAIILFLFWIPVFLAVYPGFFVYDAQEEYVEVATRVFTTHHPLLHVLLLGGSVCGVHKFTGSYNAGIAAFILVQMAVLATVFSWTLHRLTRWGINKIEKYTILAYFALFPVNVMYVLCSAKDTLFSAMVLCVLLLLEEMLLNSKAFWRSKKKWIGLFISSTLMMLFRHNGLYAYAVFLIIAGIYLWKADREHAGCGVVLMVGAIVASVLLNNAMTFALSADTSENQEILTVPIQQLARTYTYDKQSIASEDLETLYRYLPAEEALRFYTPKVSDGVKVRFNNANYVNDKASFWKLWLKLGATHPFTYLNAWFMTSFGYWYPETVVDVYKGNSVFTFTYEDSSYFGFETELPGIRHSRIPVLESFYRWLSLDPDIQKIPVIHLPFSMGFLFDLYAFAIGYLLYRRQSQLLVLNSLVILLWGTVILGPTYLPRYVLILWFYLPCLLLQVSATRTECPPGESFDQGLAL